MTFFCGYFKMYEPITWTEVWNKDVNKKVTKSIKEKKGNGGSDDDNQDFGNNFDIGQMSIVTSTLSKVKCFFAIGGVSGRIKVYDVVSKS